MAVTITVPYDSATGTQDRDASPRWGLRFSGGLKGESGCAGLGGDTAVGGAGALAAAAPAPAGCRISAGISMLARVGSDARDWGVSAPSRPAGSTPSTTSFVVPIWISAPPPRI